MLFPSADNVVGLGVNRKRSNSVVLKGDEEAKLEKPTEKFMLRKSSLKEVLASAAASNCIFLSAPKADIDK